MEAKVIFFKSTGEYHAEEIYTGFSNEDSVHDVVKDITRQYLGKYNGMSSVILFSDDYERGYPFLVSW